MRAAVVWMSVLVACGGRTLDDGSFEPDGGGSGGSPQGRAGAGGRGGSTPRAGAPSSAGSTAPGGSPSVGGSPSSGKAGAFPGGSPSTGGQNFAGAANTTGVGGNALGFECTHFCKSHYVACPGGIDLEFCIDECLGQLSSQSPPCVEAQRNVLTCYSKAFESVPASRCQDAMRYAANLCRPLLDRVDNCRIGSCSQAGVGSELSCQITSYCGVAVHDFECTARVDGSWCSCWRSGRMLYEGPESRPLAEVCTSSELPCAGL